MGKKQKQGWIDWRVFNCYVLVTLIVVLPLLAFLMQRLISG